MVGFHCHDKEIINAKSCGHSSDFIAGWSRDEFHKGGCGEAGEMIKKLMIGVG